MKKILILLLILGSLMAGAAFAEELKTEMPGAAVPPSVQTAPAPPKVDSGDTSWILISSALVMLMTPGLALFYGGMVRSKNVLGHDHAKLYCPRSHHDPVGTLWI